MALSTVIRALSPADLPAALALNNTNVPALSEIDIAALGALAEKSVVSLVAVIGDEVVGFCICLAPGADYGSVNYRWFSERYDDFVYLDRIVVDPQQRNVGIGAALYAAVEDRISSPWLLCEVNLRPRNDGSLRFHDRIGFREVGQQETPYGSLVSMLAKDLRTDISDASPSSTASSPSSTETR